MAIKIYEQFAPFANPADGDYPYGSIKNDSIPGAEDGTPLDADWANDYAGFDAALFAEVGITPSGNPDTVVASQRLDALKKIHGVYCTVASLATGKFQVGQYVRLTDRAMGLFLLQSGGTPDGYGVLDAGNGNTAVCVESPIHFKHLGAKGDNTTLDTDAIAYALSLGTTVDSGTSEDIYKVDGALNVESNTTILGEGVIESTDQTTSVIRGVNKNNISIGKLKVNRYLSASNGNNDSSNFYFQGCDKISLNCCEGEISRIGTVINLQNTTNSLVVFCKTKAEDAFDPTELQTALTVAAPNGIYVGDSCKNILVARNECTNLGHGIAIQNVSGTTPIYNVVVDHNIITKCSSYGIFSYKLSESVYAVDITDNIIEDIYGTYYNTATPSTPYTHGSGIYGQNVYRHTIKGNQIRNVCVSTNNLGTLSPAGIGFGSVSDFIISNNTISLSGAYGIICDGERNNIHDNIVKEITSASIYLRGSKGSSVHHNKIYVTGSSYGIFATNAAGGLLERHDYLDINHNYIEGSVFSIGLNGVYDSFVKDNIIDATGVKNSQGIGTNAVGGNLRITNNIVKVNGGFGIRAQVKNFTKDNYVKGALSDQSITANALGYYDANETEYTGPNAPFYVQTLTSANTLTLKYFGQNIRVNVSDATNELHGITNVPEWSTVYLRVVTGTTVKNLTGSIGYRFKFPDGADKVTTRATTFVFVTMFDGVLDCVAMF